MAITVEHSERHHQMLDIKQLFTECVKLRSKNELLKKEMIEYKHKAHYWEAQFKGLKEREDLLNLELEELKSQLRKREEQLFGKGTERTAKRNDAINLLKDVPKKNRGQQMGSAGHGRRDYSNLPMVEEEVSLTEEESKCPCCGLKYETLGGSEDSEVLEIINVKAYRRVIRRKKYRRTCECQDNRDPKILCAAPIERLFAKCKYGVSIWALLFLNKYKYQQPLNRILEQLSSYGLSLAVGTVEEGLQKSLSIFTPVYDAIVERSLSTQHWHVDETGWKVFETSENKKNYRWYLWIFHNTETVVFKIDPRRSSKVLKEHFGEEHEGGVLNVDRYGAYKVIAKSGLFILAFCWAHVRRDFLEYSKAYTQNETWGLSWVERINELYHINNERVQSLQEDEAFKGPDQLLREAVKRFRNNIDEQLQDASLLPSAKKLLKSLNKHWEGLTYFVDNPEIPMDNNRAERGLRTSVLGRKNYYGSGAIWSAELAAALFSIFKTLELWGINAHTWLLAYLYECAMQGGKAPSDAEKYLPWNMDEEQKKVLSQAPKHEETG